MPLAFVLINVEPGFEDKVLTEARKIKGVDEAHRVYGIYDQILKVKADTTEELKDVVTWRIRRLDHIKSTLTLMVV